MPPYFNLSQNICYLFNFFKIVYIRKKWLKITTNINKEGYQWIIKNQIQEAQPLTGQ